MKLMKKNNFTIIRMTNHIVWKHKWSDEKITTAKTPSCSRTIKNTKSLIKKKVGYVI
jgi:hypothetical protein